MAGVDQVDKEKLFPLADCTRTRGHKLKVLGRDRERTCGSTFHAASNNLEVAASEGGSRDFEQFQR